MSFEVLDGKQLASKIKSKLSAYKDKAKISLGTILVGDDPASNIYVNLKHKDCQEIGIKSIDVRLPNDATEQEVIAKINQLNQSTTGFIVQMPLPKHLNTQTIIAAIDPKKDADGIHPFNLGSIANPKTPKPCTPVGIIQLLKEYNIQMAGKKAIVVGRSNTVGTPLALLLLKENATVTIAHSKTENLAAEILENDIVVGATGVPGLITKVKPGAVVVDVGVFRDENGKIIGDVSDSAKACAAYATLPTGGVGPMTRISLIENVFKLYENNN